MKLPAIPFTKVALADLEPTAEAGETGRSLSRTCELSGVRLRLVEYAAGYLADHWCDRGHVFHVLDGEATIELKDGRAFALKGGQSFVVSGSRQFSHRVRSERGAVAYIVD